MTVEIVSTKPEFLTNEKFRAKMVIVGILTLNGFFIHLFVLKEPKRSVNKRLLIDSSKPAILVMAISGCISFTSWITPFILGEALEFNYVIPFETIMSFGGLAVLITIAGVLILATLQHIYTHYRK